MCGAEEKESEAQEKNKDEKEQAMDKGVLEARIKLIKERREEEKKKEVPVEKKQEEAPKGEEEPIFFIAESIRWEGGSEKSSLEIIGEEEVLPGGLIDAGADGRSFLWRPEQPLVIRTRKNNKVDSPLLQEVLFRENRALTEKLGLEAPYYVLEEIVLTFNAPVTYTVFQEENFFSLQFEASEKTKDLPPETIFAIKKFLQAQDSNLYTAEGLLGDFYQAKQQFEQLRTGSSLSNFDTAAVVKKMRREKAPKTFSFDGAAGFPENAAPIIEEAYPKFGTADYWQRHLRAAFRQTGGYSSDFDGTYGCWGGTKTKDNAWTWEPNLLVEFNRFIEGFSREQGAYQRAARVNASYEWKRLVPTGNLLGPGDGLRSQNVTFGGVYYPHQRWALSSQNKIDIYGGKTLSRSSSNLERISRHGFRMTNAGGLNYRLTKRLTWANGAGLERTWANYSNGSKSHSSAGTLNTGLDYMLSKRTQVRLGYALRHIFLDTAADNVDSSSDPSAALNSKVKNLYSLNNGISYKISKQGTLSGGPSLYFLEQAPAKFGGRVNFQYRLLPMDRLRFEYRSEVLQDDTSQIVGQVANRSVTNRSGVSSGRIYIGRNESLKLAYSHSMDGSVQSKTRLDLSAEYRKVTPLSGVFNNQTTDDSGYVLQASLIRKLWSGGRGWLELTYRYSTYRSKGVQEGDTTDVSLKEHAVFLIFTTYLGEWEEMT
jgi:hypothetical protein